MDAGALGAVPANVSVESWVPQGEVLSRASGLVCHGGAGTMLGGLAAGVPMVVAPMFADQPENVRRVHDVGAGIAVAPPDPQALHAAMLRILSDADLRAGARRIADEMAALPSVDDVVDATISSRTHRAT